MSDESLVEIAEVFLNQFRNSIKSIAVVGSQGPLRGNHSTDLDILIITDDQSNIEYATLSDALEKSMRKPSDVSIDLVVLKHSELLEKLTKGHPFAISLLSKPLVLFDDGSLAVMRTYLAKGMIKADQRTRAKMLLSESIASLGAGRYERYKIILGYCYNVFVSALQALLLALSMEPKSPSENGRELQKLIEMKLISQSGANDYMKIYELKRTVAADDSLEILESVSLDHWLSRASSFCDEVSRAINRLEIESTGHSNNGSR